ncbi:hypothetical protein FRB94_008296 [Tulasnella sp. JGI-2019a]|nr:hypothetical protein FRB94_008296 [Tulasnella sp. JGI-2019a]
MIFAFGPDDSYFIRIGSSWTSHNLPTELFDYTKSNPAFAMDRITALTLFPNNGYFVAYGATWASKRAPEPIEKALKDLLENFPTICSRT